jgi:hypothetical protein
VRRVIKIIIKTAHLQDTLAFPAAIKNAKQ